MFHGFSAISRDFSVDEVFFLSDSAFCIECELTEFASSKTQVTQEDMEAYRMKKVHFDDPMKDFLNT
jgi:hypothetical protein